ncbi:MAG: hypothetical protein D6767_06860 [Candidatus Hydrogenedentota bacterium]|nr:MAG: hypothetical protein D6767_06860 [Candidatus Hydrogenedentota bacterium]
MINKFLKEIKTDKGFFISIFSLTKKKKQHKISFVVEVTWQKNWPLLKERLSGFPMPASSQKSLKLFWQKLVEDALTYGFIGEADFHILFWRHIADSILPLTLEPIQEIFLRSKTFADLGSGAGLPVVPLAILFPEKIFYSVEAMQKRIKFQQEVQSLISLQNVILQNSRVEETINHPVDVVLFRAFLKPLVSLELTLYWLKQNGKVLYWRSKPWEKDNQFAKTRVKDLGFRLLKRESYSLQNEGEVRGIEIYELKQQSKQYPRSWKKIKKEKQIFEIG